MMVVMIISVMVMVMIMTMTMTMMIMMIAIIKTYDNNDLRRAKMTMFMVIMIIKLIVIIMMLIIPYNAFRVDNADSKLTLAEVAQRIMDQQKSDNQGDERPSSWHATALAVVEGKADVRTISDQEMALAREQEMEKVHFSLFYFIALTVPCFICKNTYRILGVKALLAALIGAIIGFAMCYYFRPCNC